MIHIFKRLAILAALIISMSCLTACHYVSVSPGEQAVLTSHPWFFGHGGTDPTPVTSGTKLVAMTTSADYVDMKPIAYDVEFDNFSSRDAILNLKTTVTLQVNDSVALVTKFGDKWFEYNVQAAYSQYVRDVVKGYTTLDMMTNPATSAALDQMVTSKLDAYIKSKGIPVTVVNVTLGQVIPNAPVLEQMNQTAAEQQRQRTETATISAETARAQAEKARADADNAYRNEVGYTPSEYLQLNLAKLQADACVKAASCVIAPVGTSVIASAK